MVPESIKTLPKTVDNSHRFWLDSGIISKSCELIVRITGIVEGRIIGMLEIPERDSNLLWIRDKDSTAKKNVFSNSTWRKSEFSSFDVVDILERFDFVSSYFFSFN